MTAVRGHYERRTDLDLAPRRLDAQAGDGITLADEVGRLGAHHQAEAPVALAFAGQEIEEIPLRHEGEELGTRGQVGEVGEVDRRVADEAGDLAHLLVRQLEEAAKQPEL